MSGPTRRLAAILAADVAGYSKLMGDDESRTLSGLRTFRKELFEPAVAQHRGTTVKSMGDGWLVEFSSIVDAVNCALLIQQQLPDDTGFRLRIGVHIGDIVHEDEDIFGDGVNVAARLQELASPGGILISDTGYRSIDARLGAEFSPLGSRTLKNIRMPVAVFGWRSTAGSHGSEQSQPATKLANDLRVSGLLTLLFTPGILLLALFIGLRYEGALFPLLGATALVAAVGVALLVAARILRRPKDSDSVAD